MRCKIDVLEHGRFATHPRKIEIWGLRQIAHLKRLRLLNDVSVYDFDLFDFLLEGFLLEWRSVSISDSNSLLSEDCCETFDGLRWTRQLL